MRDTAQRTATIWSLLGSHYSRSNRICLAFCIYRELKHIPNNGNQGTMETPMSFPHEFS